MNMSHVALVVVLLRNIYASGDETTDCPISDQGNRKDELFGKLGITTAWEKGYNGTGILVAVVDIGMDITHPYLEPNIDKEHMWNFMDDSSDVNPGTPLSDYPDRTDLDHGNKCAGLIAAVNDCCGPGAAYGATILPIKVFGLDEYGESCPGNLTKGINYYHENVDVYSCSWSNDHALQNNIPARDDSALPELVKSGRHGKGSILIFPAAPYGDVFSNDRHTVAVNGVLSNGSAATYTIHTCPSVLTTVYGGDMQTTSSSSSSAGYLCTNKFHGRSASVAIVAAIVALALEANPNLTLRDVQHLIVKSSSVTGLAETGHFQTNGADLKFDPTFGFGLLNATTMVELASSWFTTPPEASMIINKEVVECKNVSQTSSAHCVVEFDVSTESVNVGKIEHVMVILSYRTSDDDRVKVELESPAGTTSLIIDNEGEIKRRGEGDGERGKKSEVCRSMKSFTIVHFWNENPFGLWRLSILNPSDDATEIFGATLTIQGSGNNKPQSSSSPISHQPCDKTPPSQNNNGDKSSQSVKNGYTHIWFTFIVCIVLATFVFCLRGH